MIRLTQSWWFACAAAALVHVAVLPLPVGFRDDRSEHEYVSFELTEPPPPEPAQPVPAAPEPPPEDDVPAPPGPRSDDPAADPDRTSVESNRPPDPDAPDEPVPLVTGLALDDAQLAPEGVGMGVRVGNTDAPGFDADLAPTELRGFVGGGQGGGDGDLSRGVGRRDVDPELLRAYQPPYPDDMRAEGVSGRVLLEVRVGVNGRAEAVRVVHGVHPVLDAAAVEAIARFRWAPARRQGKRIAATVRVAIKYTLDR
ncbi:MAG: energy transducer TonB [Myxococcota bacterium]